MAPQIVEDIIDWLFGRKRKKNVFYGGRSNWVVPGYSSARSKKGRSFDPLLPKDDNKYDPGKMPAGQTPKIINFDDGASTEDDTVEQTIADIGDKAFSDKESVNQNSHDTDSEFSLLDDIDSGQELSDVYNELPDIESPEFVFESPVNVESTNNLNNSYIKENTDDNETQNTDNKYYVDETTGIRVLRFEDSESPIKSEEPVKQTMPITASDVSSKKEPTPYVSKADNSNTLTVKSSSNIEIYKEGNMGDTHYIAHNENESNLVQRMHPDCLIMIPDDYDGAVEEIMTCPLDCPYKVLELAEVDQKTLRSRLLK